MLSNLFSADKWLSINSLTGISEEKPHKTALEDALASLRTLIKQQKNMGVKKLPALLSKDEDDHTRKEHTSQGLTNVAYLNNSKNFVVTNGPEVKVFSKDSSANCVDFTNFSNYPQFPEDTVGLKLTVADLDFLLGRVEWRQFELSHPVINFIRDIAQSYESEFVVLPYVSALVGVTSVLEMLQTVYVQFEQFSASVNQKDVNSDKKVAKNP